MPTTTSTSCKTAITAHTPYLNAFGTLRNTSVRYMRMCDRCNEHRQERSAYQFTADRGTYRNIVHYRAFRDTCLFFNYRILRVACSAACACSSRCSACSCDSRCTCFAVLAVTVTAGVTAEVPVTTTVGVSVVVGVSSTERRTSLQGPG